MAASFLFLGLISSPYLFFAVLAARLKFAAVGAPLEPGFRIFSPLPAFILLRLRWMLSYSPRFLGISPPISYCFGFYVSHHPDRRCLLYSEGQP